MLHSQGKEQVKTIVHEATGETEPALSAPKPPVITGLSIGTILLLKQSGTSS